MMKLTAPLLITLLLIFNFDCFSQGKKLVSKPTDTSISKIGSLKVEDYDYYILAERFSQGDNNILEYTLKPSSGTQSNFRYLILDIRTGKEVSWWPLINKNFYSGANRMLYSNDSETLYGFSETGQPIFYKRLKMDLAPYNGARISLSSNWKKGVFTYNSDLWVSDFDNANGKFGLPKQMTFNGVMAGSITYLKGDVALTTKDYLNGLLSDGKLINLSTGKFVEIPGSWEHHNGFITDLFFIQASNGYGHFTTLKYDPIPDGGSFITWLNPQQTNYIARIDFKQKYGQDPYYMLVLGTTNKKIKMVTPIINGSRNVLNSDPGNTAGSGDYKVNPHRISPEAKNMFFHYYDEGKSGLLIYDLESGTETLHSIEPTKDEYLGNKINDRTNWTDDTHLIMKLQPGDKIKGEIITTSTQGTYIYDIKTKIASRLVAYYIDQHRDTNMLNVVSSHKTRYTIFTANNYLYSCKSDGSELVQISKTPNLYHLHKRFLDVHPELD